MSFEVTSTWSDDATQMTVVWSHVVHNLTTPIGFPTEVIAGGRTPQSIARFFLNSRASNNFRTTITIVYLITFVVGFIGNFLVIYVLAALAIRSRGIGSGSGGQRRGGSAAGGSSRYSEASRPFKMVVVRMKSVVNCYITNLAIADLLFVCTLPLFCWATMVGDWPFGSIACKAAYAIRENNKFVGIYVLVALSVDRYLASHYDLERWRTMVVGRTVCFLLWILSAVTTTPYWLHARTMRSGDRHSCRMLWPPLHPSPETHGVTSFPSPRASSTFSPASLAWTRFQFIVGFAIPFSVISAAYAALGFRLRRLLAARNVSGCARAASGGVGVVVLVDNGSNETKTKTASAAVKRPSRAMTRMTAVVTVTFVVTQLPYHVVEMMNATKSERLHLIAGRYSPTTTQPVDITRQQQPRTAGVDELGDEYGSGNWTGSDDLSIGVTTRGGWQAATETPAMPLRPVTEPEISIIMWISALAKMLQFASTCLNPVIYGLMNRNYRVLYTDVLFWRCPNWWITCCRRSRRSIPRGSVHRRNRHSLDGVRQGVDANQMQELVPIGHPIAAGSTPASVEPRRLFLNVDYGRETGGIGRRGGGREPRTGDRRVMFVSRESVSSSPGSRRSSLNPITMASCVELARKNSTSNSVPALHILCAESNEHQF